MRVLSISNSFGADAGRYLHQIARTAGVRLDVAVLFVGGCSLEMHYRNMLGNKSAYELYFNGCGTGFHVSMEQALLERNWDVILLQQASPSSHKPESYEPYGMEIYDYVKTFQPKAKIMIQQTWAYEEGSDALARQGYKTAKEMFANIEKSYQQFHETINSDGIIPSGKMLMELLDQGVEKVHRDTCHAGWGLGRYALGLLWFRMLTGKSVLDNTFCDFDEPISDDNITLAKRVVESFQPLLTD